MEKEIWKPVKGYEGMYEVSNHGRCRSLDRYVNSKNGSKKMVKGQLLKSDTLRDYHIFTFCRSQKKKRVLAHRLVAMHFTTNPKNKPEINHLDGDKGNNHISNLEWCTSSENTRHAFANGFQTNDHLTGEKSPVAKLTRNDVLQIRSIYEQSFANQSEIAKAYNVSRGCIRDVVNRTNWKHL